MKLYQKFRLERIIQEIVTNNKDKSLNELKRMIKAQIRLETSSKLASEININEIIEVITNKELLRNKQKQINYNRNNNKKNNNHNKSYEEVVEER